MTLASSTGNAVFWNGTSLLAARTISLVRFVILARLLAPTDFGVLAIAWAAIELLLVLSDPGMLTAILQRKEIDKRDFDTAWTAGLLRALLVGLLLLAAAPTIAAFFQEARATAILRTLAVAPLLSAAASIKIVELTRRFAFRRLTVIRLVDVATEAAVSIALASLLGVWALVVGILVANLVRLVLSYVLAPHRPALTFHRDSARSLFRFGRWMFLTGAFIVAGDAFLRAVISRRLGTAELGVFYLSLRLVLLPITSVEAAVGAVGMRAYVELGDDAERLGRALQTSLTGLLAILVPAYSVLVVLAGTLVSVLGPQWSGAEDPIRALSVAAVFASVAVACTPMLLGLDRPQVVAGLTGARSALVCAGGWALTSFWGVAGAAAAYLGAEMIVGIAWLVATLHLVHGRTQRLRAQLIAVAAAATLAAVGAGVVDCVLSGFTALAAAGICATGLAAVALAVLDRRLGTGLLDALGRLFPAIGSRLTSGRSHG